MQKITEMVGIQMTYSCRMFSFKFVKVLFFQVANEGYEGFSMAHKNMDGIRLLTMRVPDYMKDSLEILYKVVQHVT